MKRWIANTHHGWFDFLAQKPYWPEVNFWTPSDYDAFRGEPGSPFFFRLLAPRNKIGGFGYVQRHARLPEWLAWECFGEGNGAPSLPVMSERLAAIRAKSDIKGGGVQADRVHHPGRGGSTVSQLSPPGRVADHPDPELLRWHNEHVFLG